MPPGQASHSRTHCSRVTMTGRYDRHVRERLLRERVVRRAPQLGTLRDDDDLEPSGTTGAGSLG